MDMKYWLTFLGGAFTVAWIANMIYAPTNPTLVLIVGGFSLVNFVAWRIYLAGYYQGKSR
jgi:hypothetical protein